MKPLPSDPFEYQARVMAAMCADLSDLETFKKHGFARTEALRRVSTATKDTCHAE